MPTGASATAPEVEGASGRRAPRFSGAAGPDSARALGYVCIPGRIDVYPHGFSQKPLTRPKSFCPVSGLPIYGQGPRSRGSIGAKRGQIRTMSFGSARRMREDILTRTVVDSRIYDVTITVPGEWTVDEWQRREAMLRKRMVRANFSGWIRREMQERGQVHAHLLIFVPNWISEQERNAVLYMGWWDCLTEEEKKMDGAWRRHCVVKGPYTEATQCPEWMEYLCAHTTKRKASQACYPGKQWGRFGGKAMQGRAKLMETELEPEQTKHFTRLLGRYIMARQKAKRNDLLRRGKKYRRRVRRPPMRIDARRIRFMRGDVVVRMLKWVKS